VAWNAGAESSQEPGITGSRHVHIIGDFVDPGMTLTKDPLCQPQELARAIQALTFVRIKGQRTVAGLHANVSTSQAPWLAVRLADNRVIAPLRYIYMALRTQHSELAVLQNVPLFFRSSRPLDSATLTADDNLSDAGQAGWWKRPNARGNKA
jgi:hypothetical protein